MDGKSAKFRAGVIGLACIACLLVAALASEREGLAGAQAAPTGPVTETLSNLKTLSRWAYPLAEAPAHRYPSSRSPVVGRLRFVGPNGQAELYLALRSYTADGTSWMLVPLPGRPNGLTGWVPASALGELHVDDEYLRIDRETFQASLFRDDRRIWSAPIGVGRPSLPTPAGHFYVIDKLTAIGGPFYGPYALSTSAFAPTLSEWPGGGIVAIHGTDEPELIPGRPSHGCIRLRNPDITKLWRLIEVGTPIEIV
jgi:hypothetical protein